MLRAGAVVAIVSLLNITFSFAPANKLFVLCGTVTKKTFNFSVVVNFISILMGRKAWYISFCPAIYKCSMFECIYVRMGSTQYDIDIGVANKKAKHLTPQSHATV